jgi:adenosine deaminase
MARSLDEWDKLAAWVCDNHLFSPNVRWLVQVPRLYAVYKQSGLIRTFEDLLRRTLPSVLRRIEAARDRACLGACAAGQTFSSPCTR